MKGLIYREQVVVKPGPVPSFYHHCPCDLRPDQLGSYGDAYVYAYVPGRPAEERDVPLILATCGQLWWRNGQYISREVTERYCDYVRDRAILHMAGGSIVNDALEIISSVDHPNVYCVHGDLTLENIVVTPSNRIVFIDPGDPRGMFTPGLDRGKLLQSVVMRWEDRAWDDPLPWPAWATLVDWAFLVTHWVRLVRHWPDLPTLTGFDTLERIRPSYSKTPC
jgi:hypothetical protein